MSVSYKIKCAFFEHLQVSVFSTCYTSLEGKDRTQDLVILKTRANCERPRTEALLYNQRLNNHCIFLQQGVSWNFINFQGYRQAASFTVKDRNNAETSLLIWMAVLELVWRAKSYLHSHLFGVLFNCLPHWAPLLLTRMEMRCIYRKKIYSSNARGCRASFLRGFSQ